MQPLPSSSSPSLSRVVLHRDPLHCCLSHALSTEHQEVMGLLVGKVVNSVAYIERSLVLSRRDKQKDRVEVGYEHLAAASTIAEKLSEVEDHQQNVIGWYHSHPHITVIPSHVDVKTQGYMQMLDSNFVGLIFSVFDNRGGDMNVCAFQSLGTGGNVEECSWSRVEIPIEVRHLKQSMSASTKFEASSQRDVLMKNEDPEITSEGERVHKKEGLINLQLALLREAKGMFEEALELDSQAGNYCSHMQLCQMASVYKSNLLRVMNMQMLPSLSGLQSRHLSLHQEKQRLIKSLEKMQGGNILADTELEAVEENSVADHISAVLCALDDTQAPWSRREHALKVAFTGSECTVSLRDVLCCCNALDIDLDNFSPFVTACVRILRSEALNLTVSSATHGIPSPWSIEISFPDWAGRDKAPLPSKLLCPLVSLGPGNSTEQLKAIVVPDCGHQYQHTIHVEFSRDSDDVTYWREDISEALRMNLAKLNERNVIGTDKDVGDVSNIENECVVDMTLSSQTQ